MASIKMTPPTEIYVVIAHTTYDLSASPLNMYTDRRAAEEHARIAGVEVQVYLRHGGMTASSSDNADDESEPEPEPEPEPETKKTKTAKKPKAAKAEGAAKKVSKRAAVPEGDAQSLAGKTCMSVGHLHHMDHKTFTQTVVAYGGTPTTKLADVDFLVVGANAGKKVDEAAVLRVNTMTEEEFFDTIGAYYPDPPAKKAKK